MSRSQQVRATDRWVEEHAAQSSLPILERQLMDTLELTWRVRQARLRSNSSTSTKISSLFDGMTNGLEVFSEKIRRRLQSSNNDTHIEVQPSEYWRLFATESPDLHAQLESLVCGYARYLRQTSEATGSLKRIGDLKNAELLTAIFTAAERCLWFLGIYLEALAINTDTSRLPDFAPC